MIASLSYLVSNGLVFSQLILTDKHRWNSAVHSVLSSSSPKTVYPPAAFPQAMVCCSFYLKDHSIQWWQNCSLQWSYLMETLMYVLVVTLERSFIPCYWWFHLSCSTLSSFSWCWSLPSHSWQFCFASVYPPLYWLQKVTCCLQIVQWFQHLFYGRPCCVTVSCWCSCDFSCPGIYYCCSVSPNIGCCLNRSLSGFVSSGMTFWIPSVPLPVLFEVRCWRVHLWILSQLNHHH